MRLTSAVRASRTAYGEVPQALSLGRGLALRDTCPVALAWVLIGLVFGGLSVTIFVVILRSSASLRGKGHRAPESPMVPGSMRWIEWLISRK